MSDVSYAGPLSDWMAQAPPQPPPRVMGKSPARLLEPYLTDSDQAQAAAEAAAQRVRAPYAAANARESGLPDVGRVLGNKLVNTLMAGPNLMGQVAEGAIDPNSPEGIRRAADVASGTLGWGMLGARPGAAGMAGGKLTQPALKVADDGTRINIAPHGMEVPEWGKNLSWGLTAYRTKVKGEDAIHVRDARLPPEMQGQGHGTAMYEHAADLAAKENKPLLSDGTVTEDAANRWMALNRKGYNVKMAPDKVFRPGPPEAPHLGRFETPDGSPVFRVDTQHGKEGTLSDFITAYHGSPHDFDRFDLSKIGTGEGAQAYGHGLYFAENEGVAKGYKEALTNRADPTYNFNGGTISHSDLLRRIQGNFDITGFAARRLLADIQRGAPLEEMQAIGHSQGIKDAAAWLHKNGASANPMSEGKVYQVAIKAPPEHFLDWDKPLSEQHTKVQKAIADLGIPDPLGGGILGTPNHTMISGNDLWKAVARHVVPPENLRSGFTAYQPSDASRVLREAGIPGIKYLDQGSRAPRILMEGQPIPKDHKAGQAAAGALNVSGNHADAIAALKNAPHIYGDATPEAIKLLQSGKIAKTEGGTRNFVVFDDKLIDILKNYGIAGLAALPAMNAYHYQDKK